MSDFFNMLYIISITFFEGSTRPVWIAFQDFPNSLSKYFELFYSLLFFGLIYEMEVIGSKGIFFYIIMILINKTIHVFIN